ncbi:hypothetical protein NVP1265O_35 [Vibrio phage 1.265.O._10N.286.52.F6]|nr:hypothetical protein NVP1265O_35 [Vibrio phage 1.265.O._10N.286.52.F6]
MSCEDYPTAQTAKTFKLDAETVNEVVTLEQDRTSEASDGKTKKTLWGIETDATNQRDEFEQLASDQRDNFESSFSSQFNFKRIGNISDYAGQSLPEADKLNSYQFPDDSGDWYVPEQGQSFPITIPTDPTVAGSNWYLQSPSGVYRGLWPDTGGSANKGDTYQTQVSGTPTGQYFTALQNTIIDPTGDDVNWREVLTAGNLESYTKNVSTLSDALAINLTSGYIRTEERSSYGGGALYKITSDTANGFDKITMSNGNTLSMIQEDKFITLEQLGAEPRDDFDSLLAFNFARDNYQFVTTENPGVFYTSDELVPKSGMVFISETSSNATSVRDLELAALPASLINPSNWQGKAIFRASLTAVGGTLGGDLSGCEFGPFDIDATGADYAFYSRYLTNESLVRRITARNSNVCNICVLTTWFAKYDGLTSMRANDKGISLGYALSGETGDIAVNAIEFENVRANFSGQSDANKALWVDGVDVKTNALDGAGIIINTNACNFPTLQAEKGVGVGVVDTAAFNNSFGTIYTEGNCSQMTTGRADFVGKNSGTGKVVQVQNVFIGSTGDNAYYLEPNVLIDAGMTTRNSADNTYFADSEQVIMRNANSLAFANQDSDALAKEQFTYAASYNVNLRYSSQLDNARFFTDNSVSFPYVVLVPRSDYTLTSSLSLNIDGNTSRGYGTDFTEGTPITLRHTGIDSGAHKLNAVGTLPTSDFLCDLYVIERRPSTGFNQVG